VSAARVIEDLLIFPARCGTELAPCSSRVTRVLAGCRGFNGPFPLPLWMSHVQL
jgi:hypothetical protein